MVIDKIRGELSPSATLSSNAGARPRRLGTTLELVADVTNEVKLKLHIIHTVSVFEQRLNY
jgi:hypothetical protein